MSKKPLKHYNFKHRSLMSEVIDDRIKSSENPVYIVMKETSSWEQKAKRWLFRTKFFRAPFVKDLKKQIEKEGLKSLTENQITGLINWYKNSLDKRKAVENSVTNNELDTVIKSINRRNTKRGE